MHLLYSGLQHRADEEIRRDVLNLIGKNKFGCELNSVELWAENALREYPATLQAIATRFDLHPFHVFRINLTARYTNQIC